LNRTQKRDLVGGLAAKLGQAQSVILADFKGLKVAEATELRAKLRVKEIELRVIKNRLGKIALREAGAENLDGLLKGNTAWAFGLGDAVEPAKILVDYAKEHQKLVIKGGLLENKRIDAGMVEQLAAMPGRRELLSRMAGDLKQPAVKLVSAMNQLTVKVGRVFAALADKRKEAGETAG
jgi:large subunit ribosomal protein L10